MAKIMVLTPRLPYPAIGGDKLRIFNICKYLAQEDHKLTLLSFVTDRVQAEIALTHEDRVVYSRVIPVVHSKTKSYVNTFLGLANRLPLQIHYYASSQMLSAVGRELKMTRYDAVLVHLIRMAPYVANRELPRTKKILEMTDAISLNYSRCKTYKSRRLQGFVYQVEEKRVKYYEQECIKKFDYSVVVSPIDRDYLLDGIADPSLSHKLSVIRNGVNNACFNGKRPLHDPNLLIFIGNMRTHQNIDAVLFFVEKIYPLIRARNPEAKFRIIGCEPPPRIKALDGLNNIQVTGHVDSIKEFSSNACVSICPMRFGAGIQNKILESMAMGIPVVTTPIGAEGIEAISGRHFFVADNPSDFSKIIIRLMNDDILYRKISEESKSLVKAKYTWAEQLNPYKEILNNDV